MPIAKEAMLAIALIGFALGHSLFAKLGVHQYLLMAGEIIIGLTGCALLWKEGLFPVEWGFAWIAQFFLALAAMSAAIWARGHLYNHGMSSVEYTGLLALLPAMTCCINVFFVRLEFPTQKELIIVALGCLMAFVILSLPDNPVRRPPVSSQEKEVTPSQETRIEELATIGE